MKRLLTIFVMFILVLSFFSFNSVKTEAASTEKAFVNVKSGTLNVRSGAGTKYKKIGSLKKGAKIAVYSNTYSGWSKIYYKNKKAYVATKYVKFADPYEWSPGVKEEFEDEMVKWGYADSKDTIRYAKPRIYNNQGSYAVYAEIDGVEMYIVGVNVKTGWYHG